MRSIEGRTGKGNFDSEHTHNGKTFDVMGKDKRRYYHRRDCVAFMYSSFWAWTSSSAEATDMLELELVQHLLTVDTRRSLPRPLMPLLLFLYRPAKYCHSALSCGDMCWVSVMLANFIVNSRNVCA